MKTYNPFDWYWIADDERVFGSKAEAVVDKANSDFVAFSADGTLPTRWPVNAAGAQTTAALDDVLRPYGLSASPPDLRAYAASARYAKEIAGITVGTSQVATDRDSQALITGMWAAAQINPDISVAFKSASGFVTINAAQVAKIATAVANHVQACFGTEAQVGQGITGGTIKTTSDIDAAFAAVTA